MRVAVTGTPGTGKTTAVETLVESGLLDDSLDVVHLNEVIETEELTTGYDEKRDSAIVDFDAVEDWLTGREDILFESHLAHQFGADRVVVCRCHPNELNSRLKTRGKAQASVEENAESEALDVVLTEAVDRHGSNSVYEVETTDSSPESVAAEIAAVAAGDREPGVGTVSYIDYL
ncbi:adenylate kinase family protein [Halovenus rubra]|uniref:Adenylate kinase family protein n=2 Tax=Halovenus rubra TaxID=869890 RepID=A0ACC7DX82_9EURY